MKREIVIASYEEDLTWIPNEWAPFTTIYQCGLPNKTIEDRFLSEGHIDKHIPRTMGFQNNHDFGHPPSPTIDQVLAFTERMSELFKRGKEEEKTPNESWAIKKNENDKNALESFQWLSHIIYRYDTLADVTFFLQGHPHDHLSDWREVSHVIIPDDFSFSTLPSNAEPQELGLESDFDKQTISFWEKAYNNPTQFDQQSVVWVMGAQFAASKKVIRSKPLSWYINLKAIAAKHKYAAHALERTWWEVFGRPKLSSLDI